MTVLIIVAILIVGLIFGAEKLRRRPRGLNVEQYTARWVELQKNCANRRTWPLAVIEADNMLDDVLRRRNYRGKTTGERLVAAQHELSSNDAVWFGHKLRNRVVHEDVRKLKKRDVIDSLAGFRQALRDLGALK